jgi:hypothetical protein
MCSAVKQTMRSYSVTLSRRRSQASGERSRAGMMKTSASVVHVPDRAGRRLAARPSDVRVEGYLARKKLPPPLGPS